MIRMDLHGWMFLLVPSWTKGHIVAVVVVSEKYGNYFARTMLQYHFVVCRRSDGLGVPPDVTGSWPAGRATCSCPARDWSPWWTGQPYTVEDYTESTVRASASQAFAGHHASWPRAVASWAVAENFGVDWCRGMTFRLLGSPSGHLLATTIQRLFYSSIPWAWFTKHLTIYKLSHDNLTIIMIHAKATIDLRQTSSLPNISWSLQGFS